MMIRVCGLAFVILSLALASSATNKDSGQKSASNATQKSSNHGEQENGELLFQSHCGRCHTPPEALSPSAAHAVLQHMRVRAMLSKEDEKAILNYIAP